MGSHSPRESLLPRAQLEQSLDFLVSLQLQSGMIPWFKGGMADPWNHAEATIALALGGRLIEAFSGVEWLMRMQNCDGSWCHFYLSNGVAEPRRDTNTCSYPVLLIAVLDRITGDKEMLEPYVQMALHGLDYVISYQSTDGSIPWAIGPDGDGYPTSLVAASSSICDALVVAAELCERYQLGEGAKYRLASKRLNDSVSLGSGPYSDSSAFFPGNPLLADLT